MDTDTCTLDDDDARSHFECQSFENVADRDPAGINVLPSEGSKIGRGKTIFSRSYNTFVYNYFKILYGITMPGLQQ